MTKETTQPTTEEQIAALNAKRGALLKEEMGDPPSLQMKPGYGWRYQSITRQLEALESQ
jgi:hypothetical protein